MSATVDLRQLAVEREQPAVGPRPSRHLLSRYVLPGVVLLGFAGVLAWAARDSFLPARPVTVVPVIATRAVAQEEGAPLFVAAGWIEPRPTPILVTALAEGVVEQLLVVEGQEVKAGEPVAKLVEADARLALAAADADLKQKESEAESLLAGVEKELVFLPFKLQAAKAEEQLCRLDYEGKKRASGSVPEISILRAESDLATSGAKLKEFEVRQARLVREADSLPRMRDAFVKDQQWRPAGGQPPTDVEVGMKAALIRVRQAQIALDTARLRLERMTVRAPLAGRVLALVARPGSRLMGQALHAMQDASTVVSLYDPHRLQVRADVRFEDLPQFQPGQRVRIDSPAVPGRQVEGEALFATSIADIQKNTLQVKVAIIDPPPVLKPDMLVQVTFLAPARQGAQPGMTETMRLLVPRQLVESAAGGSRVWVADQAAGVARQRTVKLGRAMSQDLVEVTEGLTAADKLIVGGRDGLADGQRIKVTGEDTTLGTTGMPGGSKPARLERLPAGHEGKH
jgi:HlyD family secretion protein